MDRHKAKEGLGKHKTTTGWPSESSSNRGSPMSSSKDRKEPQPIEGGMLLADLVFELGNDDEEATS